MNKLAAVDAYIEKAEPFARPILEKLRAAFHQADGEIGETIKWGVPYFERQGLVGSMAAFKHHVSLGFWKRKLMNDPEGLFDPAGGSQMSAVKFSSLDDLPTEEVLLNYIRQAVDLNLQGQQLDAGKKSPDSVVVPDDLSQALADHPAARKTFEGFSYGDRRDYVEWLETAKQEKTRQRRLAQAIEWMNEGKSRHWKYRR